MVRTLTLIGFAMIVSAVFAAIFLDDVGARCLPPSVLGISPDVDALAVGPIRDSAVYSGILKALVAASSKASAGPSKTYKTTIVSADFTIAPDPAAYCRTKGWDLAFEIVATMLAAFAVWFWATRKG